MKLGNKDAGKRVYNKLISELDRNELVTTKTLNTSDFFHLQKFLNESRTLARVLNKGQFFGLESMQWKLKSLDATIPADRYRLITIRRTKKVKI
jgi:hypothetical protein